MQYLECVKKLLTKEYSQLENQIQEEQFQKGKYQGKNTLWITDCKITADRLLENKQAVLILLTEDNRNENFSDFSYAVENIEETDAAYFENVYRRYMDIPWDILETKRCFLRETTIEDLPAFYEIYKEPTMTEFMEDLYEEAEEKAYIEDYKKCQYGFYGYGVWTVIEKSSGNIIGRAGLSHRSGYEEAEIGFLIGVPWQRKGFATEVCEGILKYAKEELFMDVVQSFVMPENQASIGVCLKLGMKEYDTVTEEGGTVYKQFRKEL